MKRQSLFDNKLFVRVFSVALGFLLWVVVSFSPNTQQSGLATTTQVLHNIPVVVFTSPQMMSVSVQPVTVNVSISGSIFDVATVQANTGGIKAIANAATMGPGIHKVPIIIENTPTNAVTYVPTTPYAVVRIEERVSSVFSLDVITSGKPAPGVRLGQPISSVKQLAISGPNSLVHQVVAVKAVVDVNGSSNSITRTVPVLPVNRKGVVVQGVFSNPATVTLTVPVLNPLLHLNLVPSVTGQPAAGFAVASVDVKPAVISVIGDNSATIPTYLSLPSININQLRKTKSFIVAIPSPFAGATMVNKVARVTVTLGPKKTLQFAAVPVALSGLGKAQTASVNSLRDVRVTLSGAENVMQSLQSNDINAYVDVFGVPAGKKVQLPVLVSAPAGVNVNRVVPARITVSIP